MFCIRKKNIYDDEFLGVVPKNMQLSTFNVKNESLKFFKLTAFSYNKFYDGDSLKLLED